MIGFNVPYRCAPTLARQRVCGSLPQGALFPTVGLSGRSPAFSQRNRISDPENPGWPFTPASWRGKTGSSNSWRQVAVTHHLSHKQLTKYLVESLVGFSFLGFYFVEHLKSEHFKTCISVAFPGLFYFFDFSFGEFLESSDRRSSLGSFSSPYFV